MYLKQIADIVADRINDETLSSTGTHYARTKAFVNEFLFLDLLSRNDWLWARKEGTITTTASTQRYSLPRWVTTPSQIRQIIHPTTLKTLKKSSEKEVAGRFDSNVTGDPTEYVVVPRTTSTYTTGTIAGTSATKVLTGTTTSWTTSSIEQFDYIKVGSVVYTVDSVDSDTQITLFEDIITTISSGTSYTAVLDRYKIDFYPNPNATLAMELHGQNLIPRLGDDTDIPALPDHWHNILVKGAVVLALKHNNDSFSSELKELEADIQKMISEENKELDYYDSFRIPKQHSVGLTPHYRGT